MGGGAAVRAATKVAGIGVLNGGIRGVTAMPPAEQSVRNASRPVSAILSASSSEGVKAGSVDASAAHVPAVWDDWDFAEEELVMASEEPKPRIVFGSVPSLQEAKEATTELKDALEKVYLSPPNSTGFDDPFAADHVSGLSNPESCLLFEATPTPVTKSVHQAFKLLSGSPEVQTVVASIASDPKVWDALLENPVLKDFMQSQQRNAAIPEIEEIQEVEQIREIEELSESSQTGKSKNVSMLESIKLRVVEMVSNASNYLQNIFGFSKAEEISSEDNGSTGATTVEKTLGASLMGLAVMVVMVVVLKRI